MTIDHRIKEIIKNFRKNNLTLESMKEGNFIFLKIIRLIGHPGELDAVEVRLYRYGVAEQRFLFEPIPSDKIDLFHNTIEPIEKKFRELMLEYKGDIYHKDLVPLLDACYMIERAWIGECR